MNPRGRVGTIRQRVFAFVLFVVTASGSSFAFPQERRTGPVQPGGALQPAPAPKPGPPGSAVRPHEPILPKPDYAISVESQQELDNTAMLWRFRVENKGGAPGGRATIVLSIGAPCPGGEDWKPLVTFPVPALSFEKGIEPGKASVTPTTPYKLPAAYVGKGCKLKATIQTQFADGDVSNNTMHLFTKKLMLPDLIVQSSATQGFFVKNIGDGPAGPSLFHYYCQTLDPNKTCGGGTEQRKEQVTIEKPVPALKPGESYKVGVFPRSDVSWSTQADKNNEVAERDETNNSYTSGDMK
jgi:hypothetical protein